MHLSKKKLTELTRLVRSYIVRSTTAAQSGHLTSSLSAADLMTVLFFGGFFHTRIKEPAYHSNDRLIFSKGHASPLLYSLYTAAGAITEEELLTLRQFGSRLEGHPTMQFPWAEAATGSLGQGLSVGLGMALAAKHIEKASYKTFVLLGDSELVEGSNWEAMQLAAHYKLNNLIGIVDVNRLGQRGETMYGHQVKVYAKRIAAFGWKTIVIDGHSVSQIIKAYTKAVKEKQQPVMIIAKTIKGKGIALVENEEGWHGRALPKDKEQEALKGLGEVHSGLRGMVPQPVGHHVVSGQYKHAPEKTPVYQLGDMVATRRAYGDALAALYVHCKDLVVLDAETSNSTGAETFKKQYPERFFEMYIAEQNMVGVALGMSARGYVPFVSTFAAFLTRAHDQIRMSQYSNGNVKFVGSHAGSSIGEDGSSQMGLEDIALFRSMLNSVVLYPSDAVATQALVNVSAEHRGNVYLRTTRRDLPVLYAPHEVFPIGGSKTLRASMHDVITVVAAGVTLHEALRAYELLKSEGVIIRVIDLYSVKPLDTLTLQRAARETKALLVVEDHFAEGGIGEAVASALTDSSIPVHSLAVRHMPKSGTSDELLAYEGINAQAIVVNVRTICKAYVTVS